MNCLRIFLFLFVSIYNLSAQTDTCIYTLQLVDFFGDGWDGATLTAIIEEDTIEYTLPDSTNQFYEVKALKNEKLQLIYSEGAYDEEVSYIVYDPDGAIIFSDGPYPKAGLVLDIVACPSCALPENIKVNTNANSVLINWESIDNETNYLMQYGLKGVAEDSILTFTIRDTFIQLAGLTEATDYEFSLFSLCPAQDTSIFAYQDSFVTRYATDVGISAITMLTSACNLSDSEMINIELENFGGNPQSLIPFRFSVNGVDGGVMMPDDGFFTNILSKDSIAKLAFETTYDFSPAGVYDIAVWTELEGDSNAQNDTVYLQITSISTVQNFPYSQSFENRNHGWSIAAETDNLQWQYGEPIGELFANAFSGENAWFIDSQAVDSENRSGYLTSPCLDFSNLEKDPKVAFRLFLNSLNDGDRVWLEMDTTGAANWNRVKTDTSFSLNWYNNFQENAWIPSTEFQNWVYVENILKNAAGQATMRLRLVVESEIGVQQIGGIAMDNFQIFSPNTASLVALNAANTATNECGSVQDSVQIQIYNSGEITASNLEFYYQINNGTIIKELGDSSTVAAGDQLNYQFKTPFNSTQVGNYTLKTWVKWAEEAQPISDTAFYQFATPPPLALPFLEDLEDGEAQGWYDTEGAAEIGFPLDHNNATYIVTVNLWSSNEKTAIHTPNYGFIQAEDSLSFDYRLTLYISGTEPLEMEGDSLHIDISTDCGVTFTRLHSINSSNHLPTADFKNIQLDLSEFIGQKAQFRFTGIWGHDDYWLDLDNIQVKGGAVTTSSEEPEIVEKVQLFPNPSTAISQLELSLLRPSELTLQVFNAVGQLLIEEAYGTINYLKSSIDLTNYEEGIYFVKINIDNKNLIRKLIKIR